MYPLLQQLKPYPFEKLRGLMQGINPPCDLNPILLHIGEPKHPTPAVITDALINHIQELAKYPLTAGLSELKNACVTWMKKRYQVALEPDEVLPVNGSREALFSFVQACIDPTQTKPVVIVPNPFYQIYEGAALLAGAEVAYVNTFAADFKPNWSEISEEVWQRTQIVFVCSPANPTGKVLNLADWQEIFELQQRYDFVIAADECYSEIYFDQPPLGMLEAAQKLGINKHKKMMFTSLSKRSNVPSLRSGFVAGDKAIIRDFLLYRTYHGSAMSQPSQHASIAAWLDEQHVEENRCLYREKFAAVLPILQQKYDIKLPDASFYLWLKTPDNDDLAFTQQLWREQGIQVLPGQFLSRDTPSGNAGQGYVRIALVAPLAECITAAKRMILLK